MTGTRHVARWLLLAALLPLALAGACRAEAEEKSGFYYIWGEVNKPGAYPHRQGITAAQAVQEAGGFTEAADRSRAVITRGARLVSLTRADLTDPAAKEGAAIEAGDVLRIEKGTVRVEGAVRTPGEYGLEHATVRQALVAAGGPAAEADLDAAYITRGGEVIRVDARRILTAGADVENPGLEAGDVLHLPRIERKVTIAGEVRRPGAFDLEPGKLDRLEDLIAAAGGPTAVARVSHVELRRASRAGERARVEVVNLEDARLDEARRNPVLQSGDYVFVPEVRRGRSWSPNDIYQIGALAIGILTLILRR